MGIDVSNRIILVATLLCSSIVAEAHTDTTAFDQGDPGLSGFWYDENDPGQGFSFVIAPASDGANQRLLTGGWFTFDAVVGGPDAPTPSQRWYSLASAYDADAASIAFDIYENDGGVFNAPPVTNAMVVGSGVLTFTSCTAGSFEYMFDDGRNGTISLSSLMLSNACGDPTADSGVGGDAAWFDPTTAGQGLFVAYGDNDDWPVAAAWFTYPATATGAGDSGQRWLSAQGFRPPVGFGPYEIPLDIYETMGGGFDHPEPVTTQHVGTMTLRPTDCSTMSVDYTFDAGEFAGLSGTNDLVRLTPSPLGCD